jgi:hypothetical protein
MAIFRKNDVGKASLFSKKTICFYNFIYDYISVDDVLMTPRVVIFFLRGLLGRMEDNLRYITELYQCVGKLGAYTRTCYFWWVK